MLASRTSTWATAHGSDNPPAPEPASKSPTDLFEPAEELPTEAAEVDKPLQSDAAEIQGDPETGQPELSPQDEPANTKEAEAPVVDAVPPSTDVPAEGPVKLGGADEIAEAAVLETPTKTATIGEPEALGEIKDLEALAPEEPQIVDFAGGSPLPAPLSRHQTREDESTEARKPRRSRNSRDWPEGRKRFTASVVCINTTLIGLIIGIYAGEVPAIQYVIVDQSHYTVLGNVVFFCGMALSVLLLYPLPILHGRKPYTLAGLALLMPLLFPQAIATEYQRTTSLENYRLMLLVPRGLAGIAAGLVEMNLMPTLLDLFGASLQSSHPHGEVADEDDVRRQGGGLGAWLSLWTWCAIGSIGLGFFLGAVIITNGVAVTWGFYLSIICCGVVLLLNISTPETRRSPYRRSVAEVRSGTDLFRRVAKGEFMMHLYQVGPNHWYNEMIAG